MCDDPEDVIRNIPASVLSDIKNLDEALAHIIDMELGTIEVDWEEITGVLHDARTALLYLAEKHDALVVQLQEFKNNEGRDDHSRKA
jgi:hypothetical protein